MKPAAIPAEVLRHAARIVAVGLRREQQRPSPDANSNRKLAPPVKS